jgi:ATPase subunit of ABC transporter with duplicated ATPase domains
MVKHSVKRRSPGITKAASRMKEYKGTPFRLTGIEIKNVRCFEHVKIGLEGPHGPKSWAVILGDNGVGKTTLLRCIAIGMCDESSASGLLREIYGDWNRKVGDDLLKAQIRLTFHTDEGSQQIMTTIEASESTGSPTHMTDSASLSRARSAAARRSPFRTSTMPTATAPG